MPGEGAAPPAALDLACSIAASFSADLLMPTTSAAAGGAVTRAPDLSGCRYGTDVTVTAVPDSG